MKASGKTPRGASVLDPETPSPFLHDRGTAVYNPVSGVSLPKDGEAYRAFSRIAAGQEGGVDPGVLEHLRAARFLIDNVETEARRTHLLYVSLETCTSCNHRCPFCPVSVDPREKEVMSQELFESLVDQIVAVGGRDGRRLPVELQRADLRPALRGALPRPLRRGLPVSILTNASHFTPDRARRLEALGKFRYIGINLPTLDPERYFLLHGTRDLALVLANIDAMRTSSLAEETAIVVLGEEDEAHRRDVEDDHRALRPQGWTIKPFKIRSRPASGTYVPEPPPKKRLRGCELMGSRPFEHLHVTATARAVLCCQDYYEKLTIGDLKTQTVAELIGGEAMARLRKWTYGVEEAPEDFLCRRCEFAIGE